MVMVVRDVLPNPGCEQFCVANCIFPEVLVWEKLLVVASGVLMLPWTTNGGGESLLGWISFVSDTLVLELAVKWLFEVGGVGACLENSSSLFFHDLTTIPRMRIINIVLYHRYRFKTTTNTTNGWLVVVTKYTIQPRLHLCLLFRQGHHENISRNPLIPRRHQHGLNLFTNTGHGNLEIKTIGGQSVKFWIQRPYRERRLLKIPQIAVS